MTQQEERRTMRHVKRRWIVIALVVFAISMAIVLLWPFVFRVEA